jgi:pyruvate carboxylase subunit B
MKYAVEIAGQPLEVELSRIGEQLWAEVDGQRVHVELRTQTGRALQTLIWNDRLITLHIVGHSNGYRIQMDGRIYEVELERAAIHALRRHLKPRVAAQSERVEVRAHMPGLVVKVEIRQGQHVRLGEGLVVVEAMKMENELRAPCAGVIEEIKAMEGREVKSGELLCAIRADGA